MNEDEFEFEFEFMVWYHCVWVDLLGIFGKFLLSGLVACLGRELHCACSLEVPVSKLNANSIALECTDSTVPCDHRRVCWEFH
jgi:hypothetical protein